MDNAPRTIRTSEILNDLNSGLMRSEIKTKYSLSNNELKTIFMNSNLKGKKTKKARRTSFLLEDDLADTAGTTASGSAEASAQSGRSRRASRSAAIPADQANMSGNSSEASNEAGAENTNSAENSAMADMNKEAEGGEQEQQSEGETEDFQNVSAEEVEDDRPAFDRE